MEIPTIEDFNRIERKIDRCMELLSALSDQERYNVPIAGILTVKDVTDQFKCSEYTQRMARLNGDLPWSKLGKDIHYQREDVQNWLKKKQIK